LLALSLGLPWNNSLLQRLDEASLGLTRFLSHRADGQLPDGLSCRASPSP